MTADVGARVLAEGGNAVDAAVAAGIASWVTESLLTGPGGGGFMLVHRARDRSTRLLDFFVTVPSRGADLESMQAVDVPFDSETTQMFLIGPASVAVPGTAAGLEHAHRRFGSLPWRELVAPAVDIARLGVEVTPTQAYLHRESASSSASSTSPRRSSASRTRGRPFSSRGTSRARSARPRRRSRWRISQATA